MVSCHHIRGSNGETKGLEEFRRRKVAASTRTRSRPRDAFPVRELCARDGSCAVVVSYRIVSTPTFLLLERLRLFPSLFCFSKETVDGFFLLLSLTCVVRSGVHFKYFELGNWLTGLLALSGHVRNDKPFCGSVPITSFRHRRIPAQGGRRMRAYHSGSKSIGRDS